MTKEGDETYLGTTLDSSLEKKELNNSSLLVLLSVVHLSWFGLQKVAEV